jgi:hypothetical protein
VLEGSVDLVGQVELPAEDVELRVGAQRIDPEIVDHFFGGAFAIFNGLRESLESFFRI